MSENPFRITVPQFDWNGGGADMRSRLQTWHWYSPLPGGADSLVLDFTRVRFIEPWALAMFTAYSRRVSLANDTPVEIVLDDANPANRYIGLMEMKECLKTGQTGSTWDTSQQNTGLHLIKTHADVTHFYKSATRLGTDIGSDTLDALMYAMAELARNVVQHSRSPGGGVAIAQRFPERRAIQIAIADTGIGVFPSLKANYPELRHDLEALKLSVLPHVSGAASAGGDHMSVDNAGLGLFFCKEITWRAGGSFWLASRSALIGIREEDVSARSRVYRKIEPWPGTLVVIDLPENGVSDFGASLRTCRELAERARALSGPTGIDYLTQVPELDDLSVVKVAEFVEDVVKAAEVRTQIIIPTVAAGKSVAIDFTDVRFVTQSFIHALLHEALKESGALVRLSMVNCTRSTREAIQAVAAYSASYRQIQF